MRTRECKTSSYLGVVTLLSVTKRPNESARGISVKPTPELIAPYGFSTVALCKNRVHVIVRCDCFAHVHLRVEEAPSRRRQSPPDSRSSELAQRLRSVEVNS